MSKNYEQITKTIDNIMHRINYELNAVVEIYLRNILLSPSTINRIALYYSVGFQKGNPYKRYILFGSKIVMEYEVEPKLTYEGRILNE